MSPLRNSIGSKVFDFDSEYRSISVLGIEVMILSLWIQYFVCSSGMSANGAFRRSVLMLALLGTR